ncbi:hypothetical protein EVAR_59984_1 [Eumeta japonica]|uniref:Uncharacterized protein n=1 Tax=Eumeta variegata TaxID=151549 RepID=A0A4C1ZF91_EUMVA|nr:hypothetical protein EVAR_59984_1 [Eumeta japonica]
MVTTSNFGFQRENSSTVERTETKFCIQNFDRAITFYVMAQSKHYGDTTAPPKVVLAIWTHMNHGHERTRKVRDNGLTAGSHFEWRFATRPGGGCGRDGVNNAF